MKPMRPALPALLLALGAAACDGGGGGGTTEPPAPVPGALTVSLATPNTGDRAMVVSVTGPGLATAEAAVASYVVHARATPGALRAAVFGSLGSGPLLRIQVPDVNRPGDYSATVVEVADGANALRETAGYTLSVAR